MAAIIDRVFKGGIPRLPAHLLPEGAAQLASHCNLRHGELRPMANVSQVITTSVADAKTLYTEDGVNFYVADVHVPIVRHPTNGVTRYYASIDGQLWSSTLWNGVGWVNGSQFTPDALRIGLPAPMSAPSVTVVEKSPWPVDVKFYFFYEQNGSRLTDEFEASTLSPYGVTIAEVPDSNNRKFDITVPGSLWPDTADGVNDKTVVPVCRAAFFDRTSGAELGQVYSSNSALVGGGNSTVLNTAIAAMDNPVETIIDKLGLSENDATAVRAYGLELMSLPDSELNVLKNEYSWDSEYGTDLAKEQKRVAADKMLKFRATYGGDYFTAGSYLSGVSSVDTPQVYTDYDVRIESEIRSWSDTGDLVVRYYLQIGTLETRAYAYTYINRLGDESPPSPASGLVTIDAFQDVEVRTPEVLAASTMSEYGVHGGRLYRTATSSSGSTAFYFVMGTDVAAPTGWDWTQAIRDDVPSTRLGEPITTIDYISPPAGIDGLCVAPNGSLAGFANDSVYMSVPFKPSSWFDGCRLPSRVLAVKPFGMGLLAAASDGFYVVQGSPDALSAMKLPANQALIGKQMFEFEGAIVAPTSSGVAIIDGATVNMDVSLSVADQDDWKTMIRDRGITSFGFFDGKLICNTDTNGGYIFDVRNKHIISHSINNMNTLCYVPSTGHMYFAHGGVVYKWNDAYGDGYVGYLYRSRVFRLPKPVPLSCAKVVCDGTVTFRLYADGVLRHTRTITGAQVFRLPSGFTAIEWYYELSGDAVVSEVHIASSMAELQGV